MPMPLSGAILSALLVGAMLPLQAVLNARLGRALGSPIWGATVSGAVTTVSLVTMGLVVTRALPRINGQTDLPWWAWTGGLCGVVALVGMAASVQRLGAAPMIALVVTGQVLFSLFLDRAGLFGLAPIPLSPHRILAAGLILTGAVLVR